MTQRTNSAPIIKSTLWYSGLVIDGVPLFTRVDSSVSDPPDEFRQMAVRQSGSEVGREMKRFSTEFTVLSDFTDKGRMPTFII